MPTLYVAITNHGFGHATRAAAVAADIADRFAAMGLPLTLILATKAPKWLLDSYLHKTPYIYRPVSFDVGVLQSDSLTMDKAETLRVIKDIQYNAPALIEAEAAYMVSMGVDLVLADIPPLMSRIAHAAEVPCWLMGNFGWDFIYRPWGGDFCAIADWIGGCFAEAERTFRMPFHEAMSSCPNKMDVGLTGGSPAYDEAFLRDRLRSSVPTERTILLTFGGLGLASIPYEELLHFPDWQFITFDRSAPDLPNLYRVQDPKMRPVDWMVVCDRIVSKPGYSTFAEACLLDKGVITITREGFAEAEILIDGIQDYSAHRIVSAADFFTGDWSFITQDLLPPRKQEQLDKHGRGEISSAVVDQLLASSVTTLNAKPA